MSDFVITKLNKEDSGRLMFTVENTMYLLIMQFVNLTDMKLLY